MNKGFKLYLIGLGLAVTLLVGNLAYEKFAPQMDWGSGNVPSEYIILTGTETAFTQLPVKYVDANATTTGEETEGGLVNQFVNVGGFTDYTIVMNAIGGTATSTACVRPFWSADDSFYWNLNTTTTPEGIPNATSTPTIATQALCFDPGLTTSTAVFRGRIPGASSARFQFITENVAADPDDGVNAFITVIPEDNSGASK